MDGAAVDLGKAPFYTHRFPRGALSRAGLLLRFDWDPRDMKVRSSLKSLKTRHRDCKVVRRKGRVYVINKTNPRFKAKQG